MKAAYAFPLVAFACVATPVAAQEAGASQRSEVDELRAQVASLTAQLVAVNARLDAIEGESATLANDLAERDQATAQPVFASVPTQLSMGAAPETESEDGFSFKPFGRLMLDAGWTALPAGLGLADGFDAEARRARLGVEGNIPGGFAYKMELDFAGGEVEVTDALI